ncbi:MAG: hypothetical protein WDN48_00710 [Pseudolabrys sp.]
MAWFRNHYVCIACQGHWVAELVAAHEDNCPFCRAYDVAPYKSDDWTLVVEPQGDAFVVLECAAANAHGPDYRPLREFASLGEAKAFVAAH